MRRWMTRTSPESSRMSRYLPLRSTAVIFAPSSLAANAFFVWRRTVRVPWTSTVLIFLPTASRSSSRRIVSTSGSTGIVGLALSAPTGDRRSRFGEDLVGRVRRAQAVGPVRAGQLGGDDVPGGAGGGLLGVLLAAPLALALGHLAEAHDGEEHLVVVGSFVAQLVHGQLLELASGELLQLGLVVVASGALGGPVDAVVEQAEHQPARRRPALVEVGGADDGLDRVGQDRRLGPA